MNQKTSDAVQQVEALIDDLTGADNMTLDEYDEFLDEVGGNIDGRIDARKDEKRREEEP